MAPSKKFPGEFEQMIMAAVLRLGDEAYGVSIIDSIAEHTGREVSSGVYLIRVATPNKQRVVRGVLVR